MWQRKTESSVNKIILKFLECNLKNGLPSVKTYMRMLQVKIKFRLILNFLCLLALIICELGLRDKGNIESTEFKKIILKYTL